MKKGRSNAALFHCAFSTPNALAASPHLKLFFIELVAKTPLNCPARPTASISAAAGRSPSPLTLAGRGRPS
jgi:hypothetical protein